MKETTFAYYNPGISVLNNYSKEEEEQILDILETCAAY